MRCSVIFLFSALLLLNACKTKPEDVSVPEDIIAEEQMIALMADMHIAEAYGYMLRLETEEKEEMQRREYSKIFALHGVDYGKFQVSYQWYMDHPVIFNRLYDDVIERVKTQERYAPEHLKKEAEEQKRKEEAEKKEAEKDKKEEDREKELPKIFKRRPG